MSATDPQQCGAELSAFDASASMGFRAMKIKAQNLKPGMRVWTSLGIIVEIIQVSVFEEKRSALVAPGMPQAYLPGCVFVVYKTKGGNQECYSFQIDEQIDRAFLTE